MDGEEKLLPERLNPFSLVTGDFLEWIGIRNMFAECGGMTSCLQPLLMETGYWVVSGSSALSETCTVVVRMIDGEEFRIAAKCRRLDDGRFPRCWKLVFPEHLPERLCEGAEEMARVSVESDRRKEERFDVGLKGWERFGLTSPVCILTEPLSRKNVKCLVCNVSVHGALLAGGRNMRLCAGGAAVLRMRFSDGMVSQKCAIIQVRPAGNPDNSLYSVSFLEPVSFRWQRHIKLLAEFSL